MSRKIQKSRVSLDFGLLLLLSVSAISSIVTFRKFSKYQDKIDYTMKSNLETMRNEHKRSLEDLRSIVNSGFGHSPVVDRKSTTNSVVRPAVVDSASASVYRSLPSGLSIIQCGDWFVSDGVWKYGLGDLSPVGLITNICRGVVFTDIDTFSFCNRPLSVAGSVKSEGGKFL